MNPDYDDNQLDNPGMSELNQVAPETPQIPTPAFTPDSYSVSSPMNGELTVVDSAGNYKKIDSSQYKDAIAMGYRVASNEELQHNDLVKRYGTGMGNAISTAVEGALSGVTLGFSNPVLASLGLTSPEELRTHQEQYPWVHGISNFAGFVAPLAYTGGGALLAGAGPRAVTKLGTMSGAGAQYLTKAGLGKLGANKYVTDVLSKVSGEAVGSAVAGATLGGTHYLSEAMLGNPDFNGNALASHVMDSAFFGGAIGAVLGLPMGVTAAIRNRTAEAARKLPTSLANNETFISGMDDIKASAERRGKIISELDKQKSNAPEIIQVGERNGVPVTVGMTSSSRLVQETEDILSRTPTEAGIELASKFIRGYEIFEDKLKSIFNSGNRLSTMELGDQVKVSLGNTIRKMLAPIDEGYDALRTHFVRQDIPKNMLTNLANEIPKINGANRIKGPHTRLANQVASQLSGVENLNDLKNLNSLLNDWTRSLEPQVRSMAIEIQKELRKLENEVLDVFISHENPTLAAALKAERKRLDGMYSEFRNKINPIADKLKNGAIRGPRSLLLALDERKTSEQIVSLFSNPKDAAFAQHFSEVFPDEARLLYQQNRAGLLKKLRPNDPTSDDIHFTNTLKSVNALPKEIKNIMFTADEIAVINDVGTWISNLPINGNPSKTAIADRIEKAIAANIEKGSDQNASDILKKAISKIPGAGPAVSGSLDAIAEAATVATSREFMEQLERLANSIKRGISKAAKGLFNFSYKDDARRTGVHGFMGHKVADPIEHGSKKKDESELKKSEKLLMRLQELQNDPEKLISTLDHATRDLSYFAPQTAQAVQASMIRSMKIILGKSFIQTNQNPMAHKEQPTKSQIYQFRNTMSLLENPLLILDRVKKGTLTSDEVQTVTEAYPDLMNEMKTEVLDNLTSYISKESHPIPYKNRIMLSLFLGQDLDPSLNTQTLQAIQASINKSRQKNAQDEPQNQPVKPTQKGLGSITASKMTSTNTRAIMGNNA